VAGEGKVRVGSKGVSARVVHGSFDMRVRSKLAVQHTALRAQSAACSERQVQCVR
jgi:hypothetical protein